jgi:sarcosine oxidase subunit beta
LNERPVVIIGGGIIGASVAYALASEFSFTNVIVFEKSRLGSGSTSASLGGFRHQFSSETAIKLSIESVQILEQFEALFGYDPLIRRDGYCFVASNENSFRVLERNRKLALALGVNVELLEREALQQRFPFYSFDGIIGGTLCMADGHASTLAVLQGYVSKSKDLGVKFYENTEVTGISVENGKVVGVTTAPGTRVQASKVLIAAGAFSSIVGKLAGIDIPVKPYPRKILVTDSFFDSIPIEIPIIVDVDSTLAIGREGKAMIFADNEPVETSFKLSFPSNYDERVISKAIKRVPSLANASVAYSDIGLYEMTPDSNPIVSKVKEISGLFCCAGFAGHGFMHAPAIGKIMAEIIMEEVPHLDVSEYRLERFLHDDDAKRSKVESPERLII